MEASTEVTPDESESKPNGSNEARNRGRTGKGQLRLDMTFGDVTFSADGEADAVLQALESFKQHDATHHRQRPAPKPAVEATAKDDSSDGQEGGNGGEGKGMPLPAYLKLFQATNPEATTVLAVWASRNEGTTEFTVPVMDKLWAKSGRKAPKSVAMELTRAANAGWLQKTTRGKFELVHYGTTHVDNTLARAAK